MRNNKYLQKLFKHFSVSVEYNCILKKPTETDIVVVKPMHIVSEKTLIWTSDILPLTEFIINDNASNKAAIENISRSAYKPAKIAMMIFALELELLRKTTAEDLVTYTGVTKSDRISHLENFNKGLLNWLGSKRWNFLESLIKHTEINEDFNLMNLVTCAMRKSKLTKKKLETVLFYKRLLEEVDKEGKITPFEWMLKDCADSNLNVRSEIASMRFCKIIDKLHAVRKKKPLDFVMKEKYRQFILGKIWKYLDANIVAEITFFTSKNLFYNL